MQRSRIGAVLVDLRDPGGLVCCVVPVQTGAESEREALTWDE